MKINKVVFLDEEGKEVIKDVTDGVVLLYNDQTQELLIQDSDNLKLNLMCLKRLFSKINTDIGDL